MSSTVGDANPRKQAKAFLRNGQFADAIRIYLKIIEGEPGNVAAHEGLAAAYFSQKEYDSAVETFLQVTRLDPMQGRALINLGAVYNRMGDYNKALEVIRRGIQKDRSCAQGYYNMGLAHRGLKQSAMAVSAYREAIRLSPEMAEAHQNLANVFVDMKNYQQAIRHYETALELQPGFQRAIEGLKSAQQTVEREQLEASPFGRLVEASPKSEAPPTGDSIRKMSDEDRRNDRAAVAAITRDIEKSATELLEQLRSKVDPCILTLSRAVSTGQKAALSVVNAADEFEECTNKTMSLRELLATHIRQLKEHAESVTTPQNDDS